MEEGATSMLNMIRGRIGEKEIVRATILEETVHVKERHTSEHD